MNSAFDKYNFTIRVTGILIEEDKILLVKQKVNDTRNWSLPGGKLEQGETLEQGIVREIKEETGLEVEILKMLYICDVSATDNTLLHISFLLIRKNGTLSKPNNEFENNPIYDVCFISIDDLINLGFSERFVEIINNNFPDAGSYIGDKRNLGL